MAGDESLLHLFEDLEQQAAGMALEERDLEVADRSRAEYQQVTLESRWLASVGCDVTLEVRGTGRLSGRVLRVGSGWALLDAGAGGQRGWVVRLASVLTTHGLSDRSVHQDARPVTARLGLGSVLRRLADEAGPVEIRFVDGGRSEGLLRRVGGDFCELATRQGVSVVAFEAVSVLRGGQMS